MKKFNSTYILLLFTSFFLVFIGCKKRWDIPQWETENLLPLVKSKIYASQLEKFEAIKEDSTQLLYVQIAENNISLQIDSTLALKDTIIQEQIDSIAYLNFPFPPGSLIPLVSNKKFEFETDDIQLKKIKIRSGKINIELRSSFDKNTEVHFEIPSANLNNNVLSLTQGIPAGSISSPSLSTVSFDLSGYEFDLTNNNTTYNTFLYTAFGKVTEVSDTLRIEANDYVNFKLEFVDIIPEYGIGNFNTYALSTHQSIGLNEFIDLNVSGNVFFSNYQIDCQIRNYLGLDIKTTIENINSYSNGNAVPLENQWINKTQNITRASLNSSYTVTPTKYSYEFDETNSNINTMFETIPDSISIDYDLLINPLGNNSLDNDFIFYEKNIEVDFSLRSALIVGLNNFSITDTTSFTTISDSIKNTHDITFYLICDNLFPINTDPIIYLLDTNNVVVDSLFSDDQQIIQATPNGNNKITVPQQTILSTSIKNETISDKLNTIDKAIIKAVFYTKDYNNTYPIYADYYIDFKLTADFKQNISFK